MQSCEPGICSMILLVCSAFARKQPFLRPEVRPIGKIFMMGPSSSMSGGAKPTLAAAKGAGCLALVRSGRTRRAARPGSSSQQRNQSKLAGKLQNHVLPTHVAAAVRWVHLGR